MCLKDDNSKWDKSRLHVPCDARLSNLQPKTWISTTSGNLLMMFVTVVTSYPSHCRLSSMAVNRNRQLLAIFQAFLFAKSEVLIGVLSIEYFIYRLSLVKTCFQ